MSVPCSGVLDYGSQYTTGRLTLRQGFFTQVLPGNLSPQAVAAYAPDGIILSGSPRSVGTGFDPDPGLLSLGVPVLGLCFGYQFFGTASRSGRRCNLSNMALRWSARRLLVVADPLTAKAVADDASVDERSGDWSSSCPGLPS
ncbi:MAG: hypothetical protein U0787_01165 [Polyangia bacterium]